MACQGLATLAAWQGSGEQCPPCQVKHASARTCSAAMKRPD